MAQRHREFTDAGARLVGVSVDPVQANAAMVEKLRLPFPLLSDPDGQAAIKPYRVWHPERGISRPAVVVVDPTGSEAARWVGNDFADRPAEDEVLAGLRRLALSPTVQDPPAPGDAQPSPRAVDPAWLPAYLRGAKFAAAALAMRVPQAEGPVAALSAEYDRYLAAVESYLRDGERA